MGDLLRDLKALMATLPSRHETLGLVLISPTWTSDRVLQIDGPHTPASVMNVLGIGGVEAWEHIKSRSEFRVLIGGPVLEKALQQLAAPRAPDTGTALSGVPVIRLRDEPDAAAYRAWADHAWPKHYVTPDAAPAGEVG